MAGFFVAIEGIGGSGKTTLSRAISAWLTDRGLRFVLTKEPGGTAVGSTIRQLLLSTDQPISPLGEVLLFEADRAETYSGVIRPALLQDIVVIADRNLYGTIA